MERRIMSFSTIQNLPIIYHQKTTKKKKIKESPQAKQNGTRWKNGSIQGIKTQEMVNTSDFSTF